MPYRPFPKAEFTGWVQVTKTLQIKTTYMARVTAGNGGTHYLHLTDGGVIEITEAVAEECQSALENR